MVREINILVIGLNDDFEFGEILDVDVVEVEKFWQIHIW